MATHTAMAQGNDPALRASLEKRLGILHFVSPKQHAWSGQLRTRFSDFLVNEIRKDGEVVHLSDFHVNPKEYARAEASRNPVESAASVQASKPSTAEAAVPSESTNVPEIPNASGSSELSNPGNSSEIPSTPDTSALLELLGQDTTDKLVAFYAKITENPKAKPKSLGDVVIPAVSDREKRSKIHTEIRSVFGGKVDTSTESGGLIKASASSPSNPQRWGSRNPNNRSQTNRQSKPGGGAKFLHFTLYKENRDTIDAVNQIARCLNLKPSFFGTAGTKDRRAVTAQRVSMRSRNPQSLLFINTRILGVKIGDFKFENEALYLGCHQGNEFVIVLKNCQFSGTEDFSFDQKLELARSTTETALNQLTQSGFINYFGTQRFGTFEIGTQEIGVKILKGDFEGAVKDLLSFDPALLGVSEQDENLPLHREDINRARACSEFLETGDFQAAAKILPRRCNVEYTIMRYLEKNPKDFLGALQTIPRGMRTMYVHAYQSLVWNFAASKRWERFGSRVIKGDLILAKSESPVNQGDEDAAIADEETIHLAEGGATDTGVLKIQVHSLTEEEANSGKHSIFDIVLPTPGWDVIYPNNEVGQFYTDFMSKEENGSLDPNDMHRRQKDFSLPGSYRKLMGMLSRTPSVSIRGYTDDTEQLVPTDLDLIKSRKAKEAEESKAKSSGWQSFVENVQENERKEALAEADRRKAESPLDTPALRINDTWVQTSLDGSHKRLKIARHKDAAAPESRTAASDGTEDMQVDSIAAGATETPAAEVAIVATTSEPDAQTAGASTSTLRTQVQKITTLFMSPLRWLWAKLRTITNAITLKATSNLPGSDTAGPDAPASDPSPSEPSTSEPPITEKPTADLQDRTASTNASHAIPQNESTRDGDHPAYSGEAQMESGDAAPSTKMQAEETSLKQTPPRSMSHATDKKIAVILRFALDTSQYATMVLRELQGDFSKE